MVISQHRSNRPVYCLFVQLFFQLKIYPKIMHTFSNKELRIDENKTVRTNGSIVSQILRDQLVKAIKYLSMGNIQILKF